jgi:hypothetical protein
MLIKMLTLEPIILCFSPRLFGFQLPYSLGNALKSSRLTDFLFIFQLTLHNSRSCTDKR